MPGQPHRRVRGLVVGGPHPHDRDLKKPGRIDESLKARNQIGKRRYVKAPLGHDAVWITKVILHVDDKHSRDVRGELLNRLHDPAVSGGARCITQDGVCRGARAGARASNSNEPLLPDPLFVTLVRPTIFRKASHALKAKSVSHHGRLAEKRPIGHELA